MKISLKATLAPVFVTLFFAGQMHAANAQLAGQKALHSDEGTSACTVENVSGVFKGTIDGGGTWGETIFFADRMTGTLSGIYFMHFEDNQQGYFTHLTFADGHLSGQWHDQYGSGSVDFTFSDNCADFTGLWDKSFNWSGTRTVN